jgi:hypothetical protein
MNSTMALLFARSNGMATVFVDTTSRPSLRDGLVESADEGFHLIWLIGRGKKSISKLFNLFGFLPTPNSIAPETI